jgi:hypothetical protein
MSSEEFSANDDGKNKYLFGFAWWCCEIMSYAMVLYQPFFEVKKGIQNLNNLQRIPFLI